MISPIANPVERVRQTALALPETEECPMEGQPAFAVAGTPFAQLRGNSLILLGSDGTTMELGPDVDWALIDDAIARSWELAAPKGLLEAGGR